MKNGTASFEERATRDRDEFSRIKKEVVSSTKLNYNLERELRDLERSIQLLIINLITAEDMRETLMRTSVPRVSSVSSLKPSLSGLPSSPLSPDVVSIYGKLFFVLQRDPFYLARLTRIARSSEIDPFLQTVVLTLFGDQYDEREERLLLFLFQSALLEEFRQCHDIGTFMRSNTAFTKMLNVFGKRGPYHDFLVETLHSSVKSILDETESLEIYPIAVQNELTAASSDSVNVSRSTSESSSEVSKVANLPAVKSLLLKRTHRLREYSELLTESVFDSVRKCPYGLRLFCKKVFQYGMSRFPTASKDEIFGLVGGFLFLRFFTPSIAAPHVAKLVAQPLNATQRRNCTIVAKIMQNLSNFVLFGEKETYMTPFNEFLSETTPKLRRFYEELIDVDDVEGKLEVDELLEPIDQPLPKVIEITLRELFLIHRMFVQHITEIRDDDASSVGFGSSGVSSSSSSSSSAASVASTSSSVVWKSRIAAIDRGVVIEELLKSLSESVADENSVSDVMNESISLSLIPFFPQKSPPAAAATEDAATAAASSSSSSSSKRSADDRRVSSDSLRMSVKMRVISVLRELPPLPSSASLEGLLNSGMRHAETASNGRLRDEIRDLSSDVERLLEMRSTSSSSSSSSGVSAGDRLQFLLDEIHDMMTQHKRMTVVVPSQMATVVEAATQLTLRKEYLTEQIDLYRRYLQNARGKTFHPLNDSATELNLSSSSSSLSPPLICGPFVYRFVALEKENVLIARGVSERMKRRVSVTFTSRSPGVFLVEISAKVAKIAEREFDINRLLENRANGIMMIDFDEVSVNVDMLIHLLNKLFVLSRRR